MKNHIIICGCGNFGREAARHLINQNIPLVVVDIDGSRLNKINEIDHQSAVLLLNKNILDEDVLELANIASARTVISAFSDDTNNIYTVLSARQLNPNVKIISRSTNLPNEKKLHLAGANHIIRPNNIGGVFMANLATNPNATISFSNLTNNLQTDVQVEEINFSEFPSKMQNKSIAELGIENVTNLSIISFRTEKGEYIINPPMDTVLKPKCAIIILGNQVQVDKLRQFLNHPV